MMSIINRSENEGEVSAKEIELCVWCPWCPKKWDCL